MNALIEDLLRNSIKLRKTISQTEILVSQSQNMFKSVPVTQPITMEVNMLGSIRDALMTSNNGRRIVVQAKEVKENIGRRIRSLKELVHYTFVEYPRSNGGRVRFDVYQASKERVRELGVEGGQNYEKVLTTLQFAYRSPRDFNDAVSVLTDCQHNFNEYESSDATTRR